MIDHVYLGCLLLWVAVGVLAYLKTASPHWSGAGLSLTFFASLALNHWFGALVCALPWYTPEAGWTTVDLGFKLSTVGIAAFAIGCYGVAPLLTRSCHPGNSRLLPSPPLILKGFFGAGLACYLAMALGAKRIPSMTAVLSTGFNLVFVSICLGLWDASVLGNRKQLGVLLVVTLVLPFFTVLTQGFLGYGVTELILVLSFFVMLYKHRLRLLLALLPLMFVALSFFVSYMRNRSDIRAAVWEGRDYSARIEPVLRTCRSVEWFNPWDTGHLRPIDDRLNQNSLIGAAIQRFDLTGHRAHGETIWMSVLALIPRAIWPEKTVSAGSMNLVSEYTGIVFAEGVSVGMGTVFEFYINYGTWGVIGGLLLMGAVIGVADRKAGYALRSGSVFDFAKWFLIGICLLSSTVGSLVEVTPGVVTAVVLTVLLRGVMGREPAAEAFEAMPHEPGDAVNL